MLRLLVIHFGVVSAIKKPRRLPATSVINSPWCVAGECIALAAPSVHSTRWSQILTQNRDLCIPHLHSMPPFGEFPLEYCHDVWYRKTRMVWLPDGGKLLKIRLFFSTEYANVTDRRTDRRTPHDNIGRDCIVSSA